MTSRYARHIFQVTHPSTFLMNCRQYVTVLASIYSSNPMLKTIRNLTEHLWCHLFLEGENYLSCCFFFCIYPMFDIGAFLISVKHLNHKTCRSWIWRILSVQLLTFNWCVSWSGATGCHTNLSMSTPLTYEISFG